MAEDTLENARILLVEDDKSISTLFNYHLTKAGFSVEVAGDGKEGYKKACEYSPQIIISDVMMPIMNGFDFRKKVLNDDKLKGIPFVFLTAKGEDEDVLLGYDLNIEDYIIKSSSMKVVIAKVRAILKSLQKERTKTVEEVQKAADSMSATVVPEKFPQFDDFSIKHWYVPFENVPGGDFIDYFKFDDDNIVVILGDVMGKKWGAFYFAVAYAGYVRSAVRFVLQSTKNLSPSEILNRVNESVFDDERIAEVFITLSVVTINRKEMSAKYCGAGDLPLVHKSDKIEIIKNKGLLLGFSKEGNYKDSEIKLSKGDSLILFTDGITESKKFDTEEMIGEEYIYDMVNNVDSGKELFEAVKDNISQITNNKFSDDVSLICIQSI
jgi:sigma-B regulation protein RsbU (phosphoserine phosphatase)